MRVHLGDLTFVNPLGLPALPPPLPAVPVYSGGLTGLGQTTCTLQDDGEGEMVYMDQNGNPCTPASAPPCLPVGSMGPLQPGQVYCATGSTTPGPTQAPGASATTAPSGTSTVSLGLVIGGIAVVAVIFALVARR